MTDKPDPAPRKRRSANREPTVPAQSDLFQIPPEIRAAAKDSKLVIFVGAGVSALCESPLWDGFANKLVDHLGKGGEPKLTYLELEQLKSITDARRRASIAKGLAKELGVPITADTYSEILHSAEPPKEGLEAYRLLSEMSPVFVTTNYDTWLDRIPPKRLKQAGADESAVSAAPAVVDLRPSYYKRSDLTVEKLLRGGAVIHLHGSCLDPGSMVISLREYIDHYADLKVQAFLKQLFKKHCVLFVGYSLGELEILEFIVKYHSPTTGNRHYILYPYRSSENHQLGFVERFFEHECGIQVIPFCIDKSGFAELVTVLRHWHDQLEEDVRTPSFISHADFIDEYMGEASLENRQAVIRLIAESADLTNYFFSKVEGKEWLDDVIAAGFFGPGHNPPSKKVPVPDGYHVESPRWPALSYLERLVSGDARSDLDTGRKILAIVESATRDAESRGIDNWCTWYSLAEILSNLPTELIEARHIELVKVWLASKFRQEAVGHELGGTMLPRLLEDTCGTGGTERLTLLVEVLTTLRKNKRLRPSPVGALIGDYELGKTLEPHARSLGEKCGPSVVAILLQRLKTFLGKADDDRYGYAWRKTIEARDDDSRIDMLRDILVDTVRDSALGSAKAFPKETKTALARLLTSAHQTVRRIGIYVCGEVGGDFAVLAARKLRPDWLIDAEYRHEIEEYLKKAFKGLPNGQQQSILDAIDAFDLTESATPGADVERLNSLRRRDILALLQGQGNPKADHLYKALVSRFGAPDEQPEFPIPSQPQFWDRDISPIAADGLLKKTAEEVLALVRGFQPPLDQPGPSHEGLSQVLGEAVGLKPGMIASQLTGFIDLPYAYAHRILRALKEVWSQKRDIPWRETLEFVARIVASGRFRDELSQSRDSGFQPTVRWVAGDIAELIEAGVKSDSNAFGSEHLRVALDVLTQLLEIVPSESTGKESDAVFEAINAPRGKVLEALVNLGLRMCRVADKEKNDHSAAWSSVAPLFDRELGLSTMQKSFEFSTLAAVYLPNIHYMDSTWALYNFDRIFPADNPKVWQCAAQGFAHAGQFYPWFFEALSSRGHLEKMVYSESLPEAAREKALQYLALGYLNGSEPITAPGSLIGRLISERRVPDLRHLCWFFWSLRGMPLGDRRQRIFAFWAALSESIRGEEEGNRQLLSALSVLAEFIEDLDPTTEVLWIQAAPFANDAYHGHNMLEYLARLAEKFPAAVGRVYLAALNGFLPDFDPADAVRCVTWLYEAGLRDIADQICNVYLQRGSSILRDVYLKYRRKPGPGPEGSTVPA